MFIGFNMAALNTLEWPLLLFCFVLLFSGALCQYGENKCKGTLHNCVCYDDFIYCNGQDFTNIEEIYPYVTEFTSRISITDGKIRTIPLDLFDSVAERIGVDILDKITSLNLTGNGIQNLEAGAFDVIPNLVTLDLSDNAITLDTCSEKNSLSKSIESLESINNLRLHSALCKDSTKSCDVGAIFVQLNLTKLESLDLSDNGFSVAGAKFNTFMDNAYSMSHLNLSLNEFEHLVFGLGFDNLVNYDFSYNKMETLTSQEADDIEHMPRMKSMKLGGNPIHCDCGMNDAYAWLNETKQPVDMVNIVCKFSDNQSIIGKPLMSLKLDDFCGEPQIVVCYGPNGPIAVAKSTAWVIAVAAVALIIITVVSLVLFVQRRRRRGRHTDVPTISQRDNKNPAYSRMV